MAYPQGPIYMRSYPACKPAKCDDFQQSQLGYGPKRLSETIEKKQMARDTSWFCLDNPSKSCFYQMGVSCNKKRYTSTKLSQMTAR